MGRDKTVASTVDVEARKERRLRKNRESARVSREKKRNYVMALENKLAQLATDKGIDPVVDVAEILKQNVNLQVTNKYLKENGVVCNCDHSYFESELKEAQVGINYWQSKYYELNQKYQESCQSILAFNDAFMGVSFMGK